MKFKLHTSFETLAPLSGNWNQLLDSSITNAPFLRYEYLSVWWETHGGGEWKEDSRLAVVTAFEDDALVGIAPLFLTTNRDGQTALMLLGSIEISDYLDVIVTESNHATFVSGLMEWLKNTPGFDWQALDFYNLPENSPTLAALKTIASQNNDEYVESIYQPSPFIALPGDFETYLGSIDKKQRHEIRRKIRRAEESERGVHWYIVTESDKLDDEMEAFLTLMAHDPEKEAFLTPSMRLHMKKAARAAFDLGHLQLAFLVVDGQKACAYYNFDYANKIWVYNSGLDRAYMDLSVGWVLLGYLLQWANNNKRVEFDFLRGDEDYKYKFGGITRHVMRAKLTRS